MTTLAEQFHDSFDCYYAGKKTGWAVQKSTQRPQVAGQKSDQTREGKEDREDSAQSRH